MSDTDNKIDVVDIDVPVKRKPGFTKGDPNINRKGREPGTRSFHTDFEQALKEIVKEHNEKYPDNRMTHSDARVELLKQLYNNAKKGNYPFMRDILDREYGKVTQPIEHGVNEEFRETLEKINKLIT